MATLNLTVSYLGQDAAGNYRYKIAVNVNWEGATPHNIINLYASLEGGAWEYLFLFQVGTGQTGSATQYYTLGSHLAGKQVAFWAGMPGVIASNQVSVTIGDGAPPPPPPPPGKTAVGWAGIRVLDRTTGVWYSVYPEGAQAKCRPGADNLVVAYGARNIGNVEGMLYGRIIGPGGQVLHGPESSGVPILPGNIAFWEPTLNMPNYNYALKIQVSTTPTFAGAAIAEFGIATEEEKLFEQLWTQFVAFSTSMGLPVPPRMQSNSWRSSRKKPMGRTKR